MILAVRGNNIDLADKVMKKLTQEEAYVGEPHIEALCSYMDLCISNNDFKNALVSILSVYLNILFILISDVP